MQVHQNIVTLELHREFVTSQTAEQAHRHFDQRRQELEADGKHRFVARTRIGRNASCPCGSGRKFKRCCISSAQRLGYNR